VVGDPEVIRPANSGIYVCLSGKKQAVERGFPLNEARIKILNGGFRLDVATTPLSAAAIMKKDGCS
jgi:hypothetical protein